MCKRHNWKQPLEIVGGCDTNPGDWSLGGNRWKYDYVCRNCGAYKTEFATGSWITKTERKPADKKSLAWVAWMNS